MVKKENLDFSDKYIKWFSELSKEDIKIAGGKGANLGEMYNNKFPVPPGFVITAQAFSFFISNIKEKIKNIIEGIDFENTGELEEKARQIREIIVKQEMSEELKNEILEEYHILGGEDIDENLISEDALNILKNSHEPIFVSVRSSATTEDLADASFAGQQETFLNVKGNFELIESVKKCFASLYTARAVYYRNKKGFSEEGALLAVVIQKMIDSEKSGVIFSKNPISSKEEIVVEAVFGLGEGIVSGKIHPDYYSVEGRSEEELKVENIKVADKKIAIVRKSNGKNEIVRLNTEKSREQVLNKGEILETANYALKLESHYGKPQDIEFAVEHNKIYILQSRPITTKNTMTQKETISGNVILDGLGASPGIGVGNVKLIKTMEDLSKIKKGDVLVAEMTNPDMVVSMQKSVAIVTDEGGVTSHAAIVSREMGIPAVVGTENATKILKEGMRITVDGNNGKIYEGEVAETNLAEVKPVVETKTNLKLILDLPDFAERAAKSRIDSIGLLRLEGIIASSGKHPLQYERENKLDDYTLLLKEGIKKISKPFKLIWIRSSDIRTDEFSSLQGAPEREINPMLGLHGIRFSLKHLKIFKAELEAIKQIASENPDKKFGVMFPQIISIKEVKKAKEIFNEFKTSNMEFGVMIETPASVQVIDDICREVDFISFGTNDLTQYTLAVDRGDDSVQDLYDEMHPAVFAQIKKVLDACRGKVKTSICGQAGSRREMVEFLLKQGIDSISINADAACEISKFIREIEEHKEISGEKREIFDKRKQEGMIKKEDLKKDINFQEQHNKQKISEIQPADKKERKNPRVVICADCGKETRLPFKPKGNGPFYCRKCFRKRKEAEKKSFDYQKNIGAVKPFDNLGRIEDKAGEIKEKVEEQKQEKLEENKKIEENIKTEIEPVEKEEGISSEPATPEDIGVYNPEEEKNNSPEKVDYNFDEDEFSDVF